MAKIIEISNAFNPLEDTQVSEIEGGITIRGWLHDRFGPEFKEFHQPTVCLLNGRPLMRKEWDSHRIASDDVINFVLVPKAPVVLMWIAVVLAAVSIVMALVMKTDIPQMKFGEQADSVYSLKGKTNQAKLNEPIESPYGKCRIFPSYGAVPYNSYMGNDQWLYELLCIGQGEYDIHQILIEDTPISDYTDVQYQVIPPGQPVTLFPDNIITSSEVANIELFGPNEPGGSGTWIEDAPEYEIDGQLQPAMGHYGYSVAGPFTVVPLGEKTTSLQFDVVLPAGLYTTQDDGGLSTKHVAYTFQARKIDDAGIPLGDWFSATEVGQIMATMTPQRFTHICPVAEGRYEVKGFRVNDKDTSTRSGNTVIWESVRAFLPSKKIYNGVTMLAVKARASNNLNSNASHRVNLWATRKLPIWNGSAWSANTATRNPIWAFCDVFRASYGGAMSATYLDLVALKSLADACDTRGDTFDYIFDKQASLWEAARLIMMSIRAVPVINGSRISAVRDEPKTLPVAVFNPENMTEKSFKYSMKFWSSNATDGLLVTYIDPDTFLQETVLCCLPGEAGANPEKITLNGVTDRTRAYRWGMWRRSCQRYQRRNITFSTGREGHIPSYGDMISVVHDIPRWGQSGLVLGMSGAILTLSEPVTFGAGTHKVILRKKNGDATAPVTVTAGSDAYHIVASPAFSASDFYFDSRYEPPLFNFGTSALVGKNCIVTNLAPNGMDEVAVTCIPYNSSIWDNDSATPPAKGNTNGNLVQAPDVPPITLLQIKPTQNYNEVIATWNPAQGADHYIVDVSYDGISWERMEDNAKLPMSTFEALTGVYLYVRVAAVGTARGDWVYWNGNSPARSLADSTPAAPLAPSWIGAAGDGFTLGTNGVGLAYLGVSLPALPDRAAWQALYYRISGAPEWIQAWSGTKNAALEVRITGLIPGMSYQIATRAMSFAGAFTDYTIQGTARVAPGDTTAPTISSTTYTVTLHNSSEVNFTDAYPVLKGVEQYLYAFWGMWDTSLSPLPADMKSFEIIILPTGQSPTSTTPVVSFPYDAKGQAKFPILLTQAQYTSIQGGTAHKVWIRLVDMSGNKAAAFTQMGVQIQSAFLSLADRLTGSLSIQDSNDVKSSGFSLGAASASSVQKLLCEYTWNGTLTCSGLTGTEEFIIDISNRGFSTKPDNCDITYASSPGTTKAYYNWSGSTSTSAKIRFEAPSGTNLPLAVFRMSLHFIEND